MWRPVHHATNGLPQGPLAQVVAVEQRGEERAFVSLDDLERLLVEHPANLPAVIHALRTVFESWTNRTGGFYVNKAEL